MDKLFLVASQRHEGCDGKKEKKAHNTIVSERALYLTHTYNKKCKEEEQRRRKTDRYCTHIITISIHIRSYTQLVTLIVALTNSWILTNL